VKQVLLLIKSARPKQWVKNLIIFAGIIFALKLFVLADFVKVFSAFVLFCSISSCVYFVNDLKDIKTDQLHAKKKDRPLASGQLSPLLVVMALLVLLPPTIFGSFILNFYFGLIITFYVLMMLAYTFGLKNIVIIDAFIIAAGFVLRGVAGIVVIGVGMSAWFFVCAMLLALFIVFCKRRNELVVLGDQAINHRKILAEYNTPLLDQLISIVSAAIIVTYSLYTLAPETIAKFNTRGLVFTVPFVLLGVFRFLYLVYKKERGGSAETIMLTDWYLIFVMLGWILSAFIIIYGGKYLANTPF